MSEANEGMKIDEREPCFRYEKDARGETLVGIPCLLIGFNAPHYSKRVDRFIRWFKQDLKSRRSTDE